MDKASSSVGGEMRNSDAMVGAAKEGLERYDFEDEARRLLKEIKLAIKQVQESQFYPQLREQIASDEFQNQLKSVLGSHTKLNMVLYALGSLVYNFPSHHQLAIAILLKRDCSWIQQLEVYDPVFLPADVIVLKELGCHVLQFNEMCRRKVEEPTLFYMPCPEFHLVGNLLEANWCPSQINKLIILTNRMTITSKFDEYTKAIHSYVKELEVKDYANNFNGFAWHFFEIDSQMDMETFFKGMCKFSKEDSLKRRQSQDDHCMQTKPTDTLAKLEEFAEEKLRSHFVRTATREEVDDDDDRDWTMYFASNRGPRKYRCQSNAPPKDWIKLNICGIGAQGDIPAGFGGICHDESMKPILTYNGFTDNHTDESAAYVEALKRGLNDLIDVSDCINLIVEADNLKVIQWTNGLHEFHKPPEEIDQSLEEVHDLLSEFNCVAYHIYEEANLKAYELARKGAMSGYKKRRHGEVTIQKENKRHEAHKTSTP